MRVDDDGDVALRFEELHYVFTLASELGPAGGGVGILFEATEAAAFEFEVDLTEFVAGGFEDFEFLTVEGDGGGGVDEGLAEDGEEGVGEGHEGDFKAKAEALRDRA